MWVDLTVFDGFVGNDFPFRVGCDSGVRTGVGVLHAAAQLEEDLIQRIGSPLLQLGSDGGVGLLPQGGALAFLGRSDVLIVLIQQRAAGGEDALLVPFHMDEAPGVGGIGHGGDHPAHPVEAVGGDFTGGAGQIGRLMRI